MATRLRRILLVGLVPLGGCALYAPTVPSTPLLRQGQWQATVGLRNLTALEGGVAWSPVNHLLLNAEGAVQASGETTTTTSNNQSVTYHDYHRQLSLGGGYYYASSDPAGWYLAALGGVGWASTQLHAIDFAAGSVWFPFPVPYVAGEYEARYHRTYAQVYAARPVARLLTVGGSLRTTWVGYSTLTLDSQPLEPTTRFFVEPTAFLKIGNGPFQAQATLGLSLPGHRDTNNPLSKRTSPMSSLLGATFIFRPDLLRHRVQAAIP